MVAPIIKSVTYRGLLPFALLFAAWIRPCFLSIGYLLLGLLGPVLPSTKAASPLPAGVKAYVIVTFLFSIIFAGCQVAYQIYEPIREPDENVYTKDCPTSVFTRTLRQFGFIRFHAGSGFQSSRSILPEIVALVSSMFSLIIVNILRHQVPDVAGASVQSIRDDSGNTGMSYAPSPLVRSLLNALKRMSNAALIIFIGCVGCVHPSLLNATYFITFLFVTTWWSTYTPLRHEAYNKIKMCLIFYTELHLLAIFVYQIPHMEEWMSEDHIVTRLIGLKKILHTDCANWYMLWIDPKQQWNWIINPIVILSVYYLLVFHVVWTRKGTRSHVFDEDTGSSVHEENRNGVRHGTQDTFLTQTSPASSSSIVNPASSGQRPRGTTLLLPNREDDDTVVETEGESLRMRKITSQVIDKQKLRQIFTGENETAAKKGIVALFTFMIEHSYIFGLISMMVWALLYHSVFGLILLATACILWMFRDSRKAALKVSPVIVVYTQFLLCIQYVYNLDVKTGELPNKDIFLILGFISNDGVYKFITTMVKLLLSLPIFVLLRLRQREAYYNQLSEQERQRRLNYGTFGVSGGRSREHLPQPASTSKSDHFVEFVTHHLTKYWIFIVSIVLLIVALSGKPVLFNAGFLCIWLSGVICLKTSFRLFRGTTYLIWTFLIFYASSVIIFVYIYQFRNFPPIWKRWTGLSDEWNADIGLTNYSVRKEPGTLFVRLLPPIGLFVVTMLQLKFFHEPWTHLVQPVRVAEDAEQGTSSQEQSLVSRLYHAFHQVTNVLWRLLEVHIARIVFIIVVLIAAHNLSAVYVPAVVLVAITLCLPRSASTIPALFLCAYLATVTIARMIFQLHVFNIDMPGGDIIFGNGSDCNATTTLAEWVGFRKNENMFKELGGLIISLVALAAQCIVVYRMNLHRAAIQEERAYKGRVFPELNPATYDHNLINCAKYFIDFGFYKFGLECCIVVMAINAWTRMDMLAAVIICWMAVFALSPRALTRRLWPVFVLYLMLLLPIQYTIYVGLPPSLCIEYPWHELFDEQAKSTNLLIWLGLADYNIHWTPSNLVADFFLLMFASAQAAVFRLENKDHPAGDNESIYLDGVYKFKKNNPYYDFVNTQRSFVDYLKKAVFTYSHWFSVVVVLIAGLGGTSLFALGYICFSFWILWSGNNLYLMKNHKHTITRWNIVLSYTIFCMFCKVSLQVLGCVFLEHLKEWCFVRQLFSVICVNDLASLNMPSLFKNATQFDNTCAVQGSETRIGYDTLAIAFVLLQLRILHSWYFQHCMIDFRAEIILANRGAVLANQLIEKEMKEQTQHQDEKFDEIKRRTDAIRARYERQQEMGRTFEPRTYAQALRSGRRLTPTPRLSTEGSKAKGISPSSFDEDDPLPYYNLAQFEEEVPAKRAGDYYMFDYDPNTDELVEPVESFVPEVDPTGSTYTKLDPTQMVYTAVNKDLDVGRAMKQVKKAELNGGDDEERMITAVSDSDIKSVRHRKRPATTETDQTGTITARTEESQREAAGVDEEDQQSDDEEPKIIAGVKFGHKMFCNLLDWISVFLNRRSREHRYVAFVLAKEKEKLKNVFGDSLSDTSIHIADVKEKVDVVSLHVVQSETDIDRLESEVLTDWQRRSVIARLGNAMADWLNAHTDTICYFLAIVAHAVCAGLITMPLPIMVFIWGSLSNPRPSKFFWISMIGYTELVIVVKFVCQFGFMPWNALSTLNENANFAYSLDKVFGIQKKDFFAAWDVTLLMFLFYHRYNLRRLGLWKDANVSDTFQEALTVDPQQIQLEVEGTQDTQTPTAPSESANKSLTAQAAEEKRESAGRDDVERTQSAEHDDIADEIRESTEQEVTERTQSAGRVGELRQSSEAEERRSYGIVEIPYNLDDGGYDTPPRPPPGKKMNPLSHFIYQLFHPKFRYIQDLYPFMFAFDIVCFFIISFGYAGFGEGGSGNVVSDIQSNRIPFTFVIMLISLTFMIIIDRGLYLRKAVYCKLVYQIITVIFLHVWIFYVLPSITKRDAAANTTARILYIVKCVYLLVSAWQIRNGYPPLCIGNLLTHSYGLTSMVFFKIFMVVPFLFELRTAIDWTWTDTSMPLFDFFNMENFYSVIYNLKCGRTFEQRYPAPRGMSKGPVVKYMMGIPMILLIVLIIWCPLLAFSLLNRIGTILTPQHAQLSISVEGYPALYEIEAQGQELRGLTVEEMYKVSKGFSERFNASDPDSIMRSRQAVAFMGEYTPVDTVLTLFRPEAEQTWGISDASLEAMKYALADVPTSDVDKNEKRMRINIQVGFTRSRADATKEPVTHTNSYSVEMDGDSLLRRQLLQVLNGTSGEVTIPQAIPLYLVVPNEGEVSAANDLLSVINPNKTRDKEDKAQYRQAFAALKLSLTKSSEGELLWTTQLQLNADQAKMTIPLEPIKYGLRRDLNYVQLVTFVDRTFPSFFAKYVQGGIIAMYLALVVLIGKVLRGLFTNAPLDVIISEIPNPDYLLKICLDIYLVREAKDFVLEQTYPHGAPQTFPHVRSCKPAPCGKVCGAPCGSGSEQLMSGVLVGALKHARTTSGLVLTTSGSN